jgi:poly(3-hydroxybutyrate) depolymerase
MADAHRHCCRFDGAARRSPLGASSGFRLIVVVMLVWLGTALSACRKDSQPLANVGARIEETTVSGLSAGAYMAGQFQMAEARIVRGAGLIAGGPYGCADSTHADQMPGPAMMLLNVSKAANGCMLDALRLWDVTNPRRLADRARLLAEKGRIDPIAEVAEDRVFLFTGTKDRVVAPSIVLAARDFYREIGVADDAVVLVDSIAAGHGIVTERDGSACSETEQPYVVHCGYDLAGRMLSHLLGTLSPRAATLSSRVETFDQRPFLKGLSEHGLDDAGLVYIPQACRQASGCRVHVAFHGCHQNVQAAGLVFAASGALLHWADTNRLVVLFPQVAQGPLNPQGCWDWWGYTGRDYLTRQAPQIIAVRRMLDRLAGKGSGS